MPTVHLRVTLERFRDLVAPGVPVVSLTKGMELGSSRRPSEVIVEVLGERPVAALSGPSHAEEVARGMPCSVVVAGPDDGLTARVQQLCSTDRFRVYSNRDLVGVEVAGALKNVVAVAAGGCDGLGFGDNAKAALLTRGLVEMARFGVALAARRDTFDGLAGLGDLITTCTSTHGRNRRVGEQLGRGRCLADVLADTPMVAEGVPSARSIHERAAVLGIDMPITAAVYGVCHEGRSPHAVFEELMRRPAGRERE